MISLISWLFNKTINPVSIIPLLLTDIYIAAGAPPGVIDVLCASREDASGMTEHIVNNEHICKVDVINSPAVDRIITATSTKYLKPVISELSSKYRTITLSNVGLEHAAKKYSWSTMLHHSQRQITKLFINTLTAAVNTLDTQGITGTAVSEGITHHALDVLKEAKAKDRKFIINNITYKSGHPNSLIPANITINPARTPRICTLLIRRLSDQASVCT
ncbi:hypothetical protein BO83DRAFT_392037 [Aspergillus eucalypticola CBS 122712]|uniref:Aldehyde dehydrogenase domain-containing protein n=1 Tax=Aspergillus eucalypticola (strain CBS 122712 / IBT 29274) TaxID=1448314 RepID=A0A317UVF6_ASPEC|nr:uncharacterized protein BO83DRAFT_392037 [Aspergillus eucalypticola CBS 122712]PWY65389.1 hypothetical protein BO83DRAFT_392037 [Aspergillus eucalypticola CBS 122712]